MLLDCQTALRHLYRIVSVNTVSSTTITVLSAILCLPYFLDGSLLASLRLESQHHHLINLGREAAQWLN
jgi:hypothetical protein